MTRPNHISEPSRVPAQTTPDADGIVLGGGPIAVDIYIDFMCPFCRAFEERHGPAVDELLARSLITLVYHPLGILDRLSTTRYSTRASAAAHPTKAGSSTTCTRCSTISLPRRSRD